MEFPCPQRDISHAIDRGVEISRRHARCAWHPGCASNSVTIKHAAAFVILVTMAGTPVTVLACIGWCAPDAIPASAACHHNMEAAAAACIKDADDSCARLLATAPFVREELQLTAHAGAPASAPQASFVIAPGEAQLASVRDIVSAAPHRSISSLVLRL